MTSKLSKKGSANKNLLKLFRRTIKKNTLALKELKSIITTAYKPNDYEKLIDIANSMNEKLDTVHKIKNDIKMFKTINTILTNHYIKETRDHETSIDNKIFKLEKEIKQSYENLRMELSNLADNVSRNNLKLELSKMAENVASINQKTINNSNVVVVGNDLNQLNPMYIRNEHYNNVIKEIDKLFRGMVSTIHICSVKTCVHYYVPFQMLWVTKTTIQVQNI